MPLLWPEGRMDLKIRVGLAIVALVLAKVVTVLTPFAYKYAVDALTLKDGVAALVAVPVFMILAYGVGRVMMVAFAQLRDAIFAKVGQRAVRELAMRTFRHLHALSLKFHLERRTGGLSRIISRGTNGIDTILRYSLFNTLPTVLELALHLRAPRPLLWLDLCAGRRGDGRRLCRLHLSRHRMAHQYPPRRQ